MKKAGLIVFMILIMVITACSGNNGNNQSAAPIETPKSETSNTISTDVTEKRVNPPETFPIVEESITLSAFMAQAPTVENLADSWIVKTMEEKFNIKFDWVLAPQSGLQESKSLVMASGDFPDLFIHGNFSPEEQMKYGRDGVLLPLNDLIDQYAPNIKRMLEEKDFLKPAVTSPDGNIYALPQLNECYHCSFPQKMWINTEWLDNLNLKMPTTTEEFHEVLQAFKENDPNRNGKKDEIPLSGSISQRVYGFLMSPFILNDDLRYLTVNSGKVETVANTPEWRQGLAYMNQLYQEGLLDPGAFTQDSDSLRQLGNNPDIELLGAVPGLHFSLFMALDGDRHAHWEPVPPLISPDGKQATPFAMNVGNGHFAISSKNPNPEASIRIMDWMWSLEGSLAITYGQEGVNWRKADAGEMDINGKQALYTELEPTNVTGTIGNTTWGRVGPRLIDRELREAWVHPSDEEQIYSADSKGQEVRLFRATRDFYDGHQPQELLPTSLFIALEDLDEASQLQVAIKDYIESSIVRFITGNLNVEKDWDSYVKELDNLNIKRFVEIYQKAYDLVK